MNSTLFEKSYEQDVLLGIFNSWTSNNTFITLCNNLDMNNNDLQQLKHESINENEAIIPDKSYIPISLYNFEIHQEQIRKDDILRKLKMQKIRFAYYLILIEENEDIELGRYDILSNRIDVGRIIKLFPYPVIKYIIFHELMHILIFNHKKAFCTISNQYPKKIEIEKYLNDFIKYLKEYYLVKYNHNYYVRIKKESY